MANKTGMNPITIRSQYPNDPLLTIGRMHVDTGDGLRKLLTVMVHPNLPEGETLEPASIMSVRLTEDQFVEAMGYLFPRGELVEHLFLPEAVDTPQQREAYKPALKADAPGAGPGGPTFATRQIIIKLYPSTPDWHPPDGLKFKLDALPGQRVDRDQAGKYYVSCLFPDFDEMLVRLPAVTAEIERTCREHDEEKDG